MNDPRQERIKDLAIAAFGFLLAQISFYAAGKVPIQIWILKFLVYAGGFTFLIYILKLKIAAEDVDPDSRPAFKEYLKLGSCYVIILFVSELYMMLSVF